MAAFNLTSRHTSSVGMTTTATRSVTTRSSPAGARGGSVPVNNPTSTIPASTTTTMLPTTPITTPKQSTKAPAVVPSSKTTTQRIISKSSTAAPPIKSTPTKSIFSETSTAAVLPSRNGDGASGGGGVNLGLAIGLPVLFLVILVVLVVLFLCWRRKKQKTFSPEEPNHNDIKRKGKPEIYIRTPSREGTQLYIVRHAFNAVDARHLSLTIGQFVQVLEKERDGWMRGTIDDEKEGWFPASCVNKLACVDQPTFAGDMAKLELDDGHCLDVTTVETEEAECQSLEDVEHPKHVTEDVKVDEVAECESLEGVEQPAADVTRSKPMKGGALNSEDEECQSLEDVEPQTARREMTRPEMSESQKMEGFVNAIFQVDDEISDHEQNANEKRCNSVPVIVEMTPEPTEPVPAPRKHIPETKVETEVENNVALTEDDHLKTSEVESDGGQKEMLRLDTGLTEVGKLFVAEEVFTPTSPNHLRLGKGDLLQREDERHDWMKGTNVTTGETGWFPSEYVSEKATPQKLDPKSEDTAVSQTEDISPTVVCHLSQTALDAASMAELAAKSIDITTSEHSSDDVPNSEKTVPGIHLKELSDDLGPPSPDSGFESPRQNVKPMYDDHDAAVHQATSQDVKDPETSHKEKKPMPEIPMRFVTPKLVKIARKASDGKDVKHHHTLSEPVTPHQTEGSVKDTTEHVAKYGDAKGDASDTPQTKESFVDDFMNRMSPEIVESESAVTEEQDASEEHAVSPEPETSSTERPDVPSKPARLKFWNKRPKSLKQLLHVNLPGSGRKHRTTDPESPSEEKDMVRSLHGSSQEVANPVSPKEKPPRPSRPPSSQSPVNGDLPSPGGKPPKPPRPTSPPLRSPDAKATTGFPKLSMDTHGKDTSQEAAASPKSGQKGMVDEVGGKVDDISEDGHVEVVSHVYGTLRATPAGDGERLHEELEPSAAGVEKSAEPTQEDVLSSSPSVSNGDVEPHNNRDNAKEDEGAAPAISVNASDDANTTETMISPDTTVKHLTTANTTLNSTPDVLPDEPTPDTTPNTDIETLPNVSNDSSLPAGEEKPESPGAIEHKPELPVNPVQSEDIPNGEQDKELPALSATLPPLSTEKESSSGDYHTPVPIQNSPDTSPISPLRFFTPAGFVAGPSPAKRELDFSMLPESKNLPKSDDGEMKTESKITEGGKDPVSPLRFFTPVGFIPGSPSPKQGVAINVTPAEPVKTEDVMTEEKPSSEGEREVSPFKLFTPAGFVQRSPSPEHEPVLVSPPTVGHEAMADDDVTIKTEDHPSERKKDGVSPLRFFTPPAFAPQQGHYNTVHLLDTMGGDIQDTEDILPRDARQTYREDDSSLSDDSRKLVDQMDKDDKMTLSPNDKQEVDTQRHKDGDNIMTHVDRDDTCPAAITNGDKSVSIDTEASKDTGDNAVNTSFGSDSDINTRLRFFTPAQFTPFNSHPDKISPVHAPAYTTSTALENSVTEARERATESLKETLESPKETTEPPKETTEPPKETTEPPKETTEPPKETTEPPKDTTEPPKETTEPPKDTTEPPKEIIKPPKETTEPPKDTIESPKETIEPPKDTTNVTKSKVSNPSESLHIVTTSSPEEPWKGINGDTHTEVRTSQKMISSPPVSPTLFTATGYSSPKIYQPFHKFNLGSSPLADDTKEVTDGSPDEACPSLPVNGPPPLPDCPPPPLEDY